MQIESAVRTHVGRRANNEDDHCVEPGLGLYAVADGMGGYEGGEVASQIVVKTLTEFFARNEDDDEVTWPVGLDPALGWVENLMVAGIGLANRAVQSQRRGRLAAMGSTVAALAIRSGQVVVAHVGDARVYRLRGGALDPMTIDHSLVEELTRHGMEVPESHNISNVVTRAIGMDRCMPDVRTDEVAPGDVYLVCSDGLYEPLEEAEIEAILASSCPGSAAAELVERAYEAGGSDNITALVVAVRKGEEA